MRWGLTSQTILFQNCSLPGKFHLPDLDWGPRPSRPFSPGQPAGSGRSHKPARLGGPRRGDSLPPAAAPPVPSRPRALRDWPKSSPPGGRSPAPAPSDAAQPPPSAQPGPARRSAVPCAPHARARTPELTKPPEPRATSRCRAARPTSPAPA